MLALDHVAAIPVTSIGVAYSESTSRIDPPPYLLITSACYPDVGQWTVLYPQTMQGRGHSLDLSIY